MGWFGKSDHTVKPAGKQSFQADKRPKMHGSRAERDYWKAQGKLGRMTDRPGKLQRGRP